MCRGDAQTLRSTPAEGQSRVLPSAQAVAKGGNAKPVASRQGLKPGERWFAGALGLTGVWGSRGRQGAGR